MAVLISRREVEPGVFKETWEEDARIYHLYRDTSERERDAMRASLRAVHPKWGRKDSPFQGIGYIAPHEREILVRKYPDLKNPDAREAFKAWKRFWCSTESERFRTVQKV